ncbi:MAG: HD domain-containing protein [Candidatus Aenigmarchaeota archaeon]|nr:HD domain-containing protein [Candidatus Aenigmarchaeota archaeon]
MIFILRTQFNSWKVLSKIKYPESVAAHSYGTAVLAMVLAKKLNVNQERLIKMALIHDLAESIIGDIPMEYIENGKVSEIMTSGLSSRRDCPGRPWW